MALRTAALVGATASLAWLLDVPTSSSEDYAFAQVQKQVERVRTVDYIETTIHVQELPEGAVDARFAPGETAQSVTKKEIAALERRLKSANAKEKQDIELRLRLLRPLLQGKPQRFPEDIRRVRVKGKHLQRTDHIFPYGQFHGVRNAKTGASVSFDHEHKTKTVRKTQVVIRRETGEKTEHTIEFSPAVDFFQRFRAVPAKATVKLPKQKIEGQDAIGFRSVEKHADGTWTRTYWVHPESKLPIQIVTDFKSVQPKMGSSRWVQDRFVFDAESDNALFDTETPIGYQVKDGTVYGFQ